MPEIRLVRGTHRLTDGERVESGDTVELSQERIDRLPDPKYEVVSDGGEDESENAAPDEADDASSAEDTDETTDTTEEDTIEDSDTIEEVTVEDIIPYDDYSLLSSMAAEYDGDGVHGAMSQDEITVFFETLEVPTVQSLKRQAEGDL